MTMEKRNHINPDGSVVTIYVGEGVKIGEGAVIHAGAVIREGAEIGKDAVIHAGAVIHARAEIGDGAEIGKDAVIGAWTEIGMDAVIGAGAVIGAWVKIGARTKIGAGAKIGEDARIAEGSQTLYPVYISRLGDDRAGWLVTMTREYMQIGCQMRPTCEWWSLDDRSINEMDRGALRWWRTYKPALMAIAAAKGWTDGMPEAADNLGGA